MMPGTFRYSASQDDSKSQQLPPPVAPQVTVQSWRESTTSVAPPDAFGHHIRSGSVDSLDSSSGSSVSSSSSSGNHSRQLSGDSGEYIPTRTVIKPPVTSVHNPLQFIKVQSPLYRKAEQQVKLVKEVKVTREKVKEGEEEWQSNLDNWKSRRRKVSEKVFQRAEEMRQIEAEEQVRQQQQQQQRKIKTFSEIVEHRSQKKCSYNLDLYVGQGNDSGLGATPEPEDQDSLDHHNLGIKSDASEEITSEAESVDSDVRVSEKSSGKEPPKVPKKPYSWLSRTDQNIDVFNMNSSAVASELMQECLKNELCHLDNPSSSEPSDVEGHAADAETVSSEDDAIFCAPPGNVDSGLESLCDSHRAGDIADSASDFSQDSCSGVDINHEIDPPGLASYHELDVVTSKKKETGNHEFSDVLKNDGQKLSFKLLLKQGMDSKGFGFSLKGGKNQGSAAYVESVIPGGSADIAGLNIEDEVLSINGEGTSGSSHASLVFVIKQAVYMGQLDLVVWRSSRSENQDLNNGNAKPAKKGSSFADKIAMFSSGLSSPVTHSTPAVSNSSVQLRKDTKTEDLKKKESLVLRRRSAFENSCTNESQNKNRWSANLSNETSVKSHHYERQHSADFTSSINKFSSVSTVTKKAPPPPVPLKPKLKPKVQDSTPLFIINSASKESEVDVNIQTLNNKHADVRDNTQEMVEECRHTSFLEQKELIYKVCDAGKIYLGDQNCPNNSVCASEALNSSAESDSLEQTYSMNLCETESHVTSTDSSKNFVHAEVSCNEASPHCSEENKLIVYNSYNCENYVKSNENPVIENRETVCNTLQTTEECTPVDAVNSTVPSALVSSKMDASLDSESNIDLTISNENNPFASHAASSDLNQLPSISNSVVNDDVKLSEMNLDIALEEEKEILPEDMHMSNIVEEFENETEEQWEDVTSSKDNPEMTEDEFGSTEKGLHMEINMQTLGLALEKIEEDDVVSASTTASSETPDTETVIEHFPTNISPLPNDDIINDDIINESFNHESTDSELNVFQTPVVDLTDATADENVAHNVSVPDVPELPYTKDAANFQECDRAEVEQGNFNSPTNTALLDIRDIDEIERRLMLQLEQEEIILEDINVDNSELKDEVDRQLLYLSDDSYLLDDLDAPPRHIAPPSEPPPPPPPPEIENEENKTPSLMRVNSTKRIKKEIWRRRSDFLGLDSPEAISVDDIPPPPPGLEELFKSEMEMGREQKLWLEKRLSLAEPAPPSEFTSSDASSANTLCHDGTFSLEHMLKVLDAEVYDAVSCDRSQSDMDGNECHLADGEQFVCESLPTDVENDIPDNLQQKNAGGENTSDSPQHKAKQNIQSLGAAPRAKIMDSNKWITQTEKASPKKQKAMDPVFRDSSYSQNFWISKEANRSAEASRSHIPADRRFSMPPAYSSRQPDVTVRTWGDRELGSYPQQPRPKSCLWQTQQQPSIPDTYDSHYYPNSSGLGEESKVNFLENQPASQNDTLVDTVGGIPRSCSYCGDELTDGSAMGIDALELYFHIECFRCCVCQMQLGNGSCGTDVQVKNNQLYCHSCFRGD